MPNTIWVARVAPAKYVVVCDHFARSNWPQIASTFSVSTPWWTTSERMALVHFALRSAQLCWSLARDWCHAFRHCACIAVWWWWPSGQSCREHTNYVDFSMLSAVWCPVCRPLRRPRQRSMTSNWWFVAAQTIRRTNARKSRDLNHRSVCEMVEHVKSRLRFIDCHWIVCIYLRRILLPQFAQFIFELRHRSNPIQKVHCYLFNIVIVVVRT